MIRFSLPCHCWEFKIEPKGIDLWNAKIKEVPNIQYLVPPLPCQNVKKCTLYMIDMDSSHFRGESPLYIVCRLG